MFSVIAGCSTATLVLNGLVCSFTLFFKLEFGVG